MDEEVAFIAGAVQVALSLYLSVILLRIYYPGIEGHETEVAQQIYAEVILKEE